jgi:hypothetical protein
MRRLWSLASGVLVLGMIVGCQNQKGEQTVGTPSLAHPRSAELQQKRALRYDPYPATNVGPEMVGVRPREYQNPPDEVSRGRWGPINESKTVSKNSERWGTPWCPSGSDPQ